MANLNNSVRQWLTQSQYVKVTPGRATTEMELHASYHGYCLHPAYLQSVNLKNFRFRMDELKREFGFTITTKLSP